MVWRHHFSFKERTFLVSSKRSYSIIHFFWYSQFWFTHSIIFAPSTHIVTISDCSSLRYVALLGYVLLFHSVPAKRFTASIQNHCTDSTLYTYSTLSTWKTEGHENSQANTWKQEKWVGTSLFCFVKVPTLFFFRIYKVYLKIFLKMSFSCICSVKKGKCSSLYMSIVPCQPLAISQDQK